MVMTVEERKAYKVKWAATNRDKVNAANKRYRENNKDRLAIMYKKYNKTHKENKEKWTVANRDKIKKASAKYVKNNKDKVNALSANRRAKMFGATIYMTKEDKAKIAELYKIAKDASKLFGYTWEVDHIVPLNKGGLHKLSNLQVVPMNWNRVKSDKNCNTYWD